MGWSYTSNGGIVFDLDDPRFTSPMSVISGLASGYCERKAAVDATYAAASWTTDAVKKNTVSRLAANIAINHDIGTVSAYGAGSETFQAPQSWTVGNPAQTKTFMDYFDHDLTTLANSYVTSGGIAYDGFAGLAVAASARADSDATVSNYTGYTVGTTATSGGAGGVAGTSEYTGTFVPMFAAGWAVERRDMLEELRYVKEAETMGMLEADDNDPFYILQASGTAVDNDTYVEDAYDYPVRDYGGDCDFAYGSADVNGNYTSMYCVGYGIDCDVYNTTAATANVAYFVQVDAGDAWSRISMDYMNMDYVENGAIVYAAAQHEYCVKSGGTLFTRFDDEAGNVVVESGGSLVCLGPPTDIPVRQNATTYAAGAKVLPSDGPLMVYLVAQAAGKTGAAPPVVTDWEDPITDGTITWDPVWFGPGVQDVNLFSGATVIPYTVGNQFTAFANHIAYAFRTTYAEWRDAAESYGDTFKQGYYYAGGNVTVASDARAMVVGGASAVIASGASCVYISGATASLGPGDTCSRVVVDDGGKFVIDGGILDAVSVLPGGSLVFSGRENNSGYTGELLISSGASVLINSPHTSMGHLRLFDDAILDVADGAYTSEEVYQNIYYSTILHFCTFGLFGDPIDDDVHSGWHTAVATRNTAAVSDSEYHIAGTSDPAEGSATVSNYVAGDFNTLSARVSGSFYVGGVEYLPEEALRQFEPDDVAIYYGASIRGINSRGGAYTIDDKYPQFTYRKFGDDHK